MVVLAFDFGTKRIGVAAGQTITAGSTALMVIKVHNNRPDWSAISAVLKEWEPDSLVVGLPTNEDGSNTTVSARTRRFARQLEGRYHLPVIMLDERLSSYEARARCAGKEPRSGIDAVAAQVILESWLATHSPA